MKKISYILILFISLFIVSSVKAETKDLIGCTKNTTYDSCKNDSNYSCVWVDRDSGKVANSSATNEEAYCNVDNLQYVSCGDAYDIPATLPKYTAMGINILKIATPIILIFVSVVSLIKAITSDKEDEMEKAKKTLIRRIIIAAIIFFTITITQFVIDKVVDEKTEKDSIASCLECFIDGNCGGKYYKSNIPLTGNYVCTYTDGTPFSAEAQEKYCH